MNTSRTFGLQVAEGDEEKAVELQKTVDRGVAHLNGKQFDAAISAFKTAIAGTQKGTPVHDIITHNLLTAYKGRIAELLAAGEPLHVNRYLPEVSALDLTSELRDDAGFRQTFADQWRNLALDFYGNRQHEPALFFMRKALTFEKCPSYYVDLTNALAWTRQKARLADYTTAYTETDLGKHIFLACAPKSGSTFLKNVLQSVTGFRNMFSVYAALQNEQEMDLPHLVKFGNVNTVTQQHARASEANVQMMQAFGIRPTVLVRNIFDTAVSLLDFYSSGYIFSTFFDRDDFEALSSEQKIDLLIDNVLPWYFQFVASWQRVEADGRLEIDWLTYEEMVSDKTGTVERILRFNGLDADRSVIEQHISNIEGDRDKNRFNRGTTGRGESVLSEEQRIRITELARHFPSRDFGVLGI
jgi:hypothetical protein